MQQENLISNGQNNIQIENRKKACITGVSEVDGFNENRVEISLTCGKRLFVFGNNLKIAGFSKQTGGLSIEGEICQIRYGWAKTNLVKKLFK